VTRRPRSRSIASSVLAVVMTGTLPHFLERFQ
jgi:hypothetical protein